MDVRIRLMPRVLTVWLWEMWMGMDVTRLPTDLQPSTMMEPCCILPDWDMAMRSILPILILLEIEINK